MEICDRQSGACGAFSSLQGVFGGVPGLSLVNLDLDLASTHTESPHPIRNKLIVMKTWRVKFKMISI